MKKRKQKCILTIFTLVIIIMMSLNCYAHSGRTDANGGHKDNKNKSGLGSYHYHCGGHPAHLHPNGTCPHSSTTKANQGSATKKKSNTKTTTTTPVQTTEKKIETKKDTTVAVKEITLTASKTEIEVGEQMNIIATITPENATDKKIKWETSNENTISINEQGTITGKMPGIVTITATGSGNKKGEMKITVKQIENKKENKNDNTIETETNIITKEKQGSNPIGGIATVAILAGGGYWGYKKMKK